MLTEMMFEKYPNDRLKAFEEYSKHRNPDAEAMCDLAMYNYIEVRKKSLLLVADLGLGYIHEYSSAMKSATKLHVKSVLGLDYVFYFLI